MNLQSHRELDVTREKLRLLEERFEASKREQGGDEHARELSMRSLKRLINQLKEEIARNDGPRGGHRRDAHPRWFVSDDRRIHPMKVSVAEELTEAISELRVLFPDWRMGQLVANLVTAAGGADANAIWDMEDDELLAAARRLIERNRARGTTDDESGAERSGGA